MIYRYTYKITCTHQDNIGDYYYGARITDIEPEKDPYKGSGKNIITYYKQHPNNYIKEIIETYDNDEVTYSPAGTLHLLLQHGQHHRHHGGERCGAQRAGPGTHQGHPRGTLPG